tara:strand:- start:4556 stop:6232 length:1677 start_codon:yes stop_codon:yes gene_type:complete
MGSNNPFDMLQNKSSTWQDIAGALYGGYKSRSKKDRRAKLLAMGLLIGLNAKENRMIADTNRKIRALESENVTEQARALHLWGEHAKVAEDHKKYLNDENYFYTQAEELFDSNNKNWYAGNFGLQGTSQAASEMREKEIKEQADYLKNQHFLKMNYKPIIDPKDAKKDGRFDFNLITKLPKDQDPKNQIRNVYQTKEQFMKPVEDYIIAKQENILDPKNISWAHGLLARFGRDTMVDDPVNEGKKVSLIELQKRAKTSLDIKIEGETELLTVPVVTNEDLKKLATIPRFRNIYRTEMVQDPNNPDKKVSRPVFTFGKDEAHQRTRMLTQNMDAALQKNISLKLDASQETKFSMRDIEGIILSETLLNNEVSNVIQDRTAAYRTNFATTNNIADIDTWAKTINADQKQELLRLSYIGGRTEIVDEALGVDDEMRKNINKVKKIKLILMDTSGSFDKVQKATAKKELTDMTTSTVDATLAVSLAREANDSNEHYLRTYQYQEKHTIYDNAGNILRSEIGMQRPDLDKPGEFKYITNDSEWIIYQHKVSKSLIDSLLGLDL